MIAYQRAFVSHAHADNDLCDTYVTAFGRCGVSLYYDRANPQVGHDLGEALERELEQAGVLIVMVTPAALTSFWVREEIGIFFSLMARDPARLLVPIKLAPCELPLRLAARWWVDATILPQAEVVEQVVHALAVTAPVKPSVTPLPRTHDVLPPLGPAPTPASSNSALHLTPKHLYDLGYRGYSVKGVECIQPPICPVPAGIFTMGSDKVRDSQADDEETPQYLVEVGDFAIGQHPVTVAEYACGVRARAVREPGNYLGNKKVDWATQQAHPDHPVVWISWHDALSYVRWLAKTTGQRWRLPSEAEWEKAARGADGRIYPWGDTFDKTRCNTDASGIKTTTPVGKYPNGESPYHVQDMAGNVWEWTSSLWRSYPYQKDDGREHLDSTEDKIVLDSTVDRILRGGTFFDNAKRARVAYRAKLGPYNPSLVGRGSGIGFRLAIAAGS